MPVGSIHKAGQLELASILMLANVNKLQSVDACLHLLASECPLTQVGMRYKTNQVAYIIRMRIASPWVFLTDNFQNR